MTDRELMQQALDAFGEIAWSNNSQWQADRAKVAISALRERLAQPEGCQCPACKVTPHASDCAVHSEPAYPNGECNCGAQPEQEPVAWMTPTGALYRTEDVDGCFDDTHIPLYTTPPQRKPWVGLTDVEWMNIVNKDHAWFGQRPEDVAHEVAKLVEAKLREKNA